MQHTVKCQDERTARDFLIQNLGSVNAEVADSALQSVMARNLRLKTACPFRRTGRKPTFTKDKLSLCCSLGFPWEHRSRHYSSNCRGSCASHQQQGALGWKIVFHGETTWQPNFIDDFTHFFWAFPSWYDDPNKDFHFCWVLRETSCNSSGTVYIEH